MTYYDDIAAGYEELHKEEQFNKLGLIKNHLPVNKDTKLLDVGCGTGWAAEFFDCNFQGIDPAEKLVNIGLSKGLTLQVAKAEELPFEDESFDAVISVTAIMNFESVEKGLDEIKRVAKKDIVITCLKDSPKILDVEMAVRERFIVMDVIENEHDLFFFCHKN